MSATIVPTHVLDTSPAPVPDSGRIQLALNVDDLDAAIAFYSRLFNTAPAKIKPGYANFAIAEPPLKLVLIEQPGSGGTLNHLGVEVTSTAAVDRAGDRLRDIITLESRDEACCYAVQDKVWVADPGGARWEVYTVLGDAEVFTPEVADGVTADACCSTDEAPAAAVACC